MLAVCLACARRADRYWVVWASSFALLNLITDLMGLLIPRVTFWSYEAAGFVWVDLFDAAILSGVWSTARARRASRQG
ncbi:MAG: hypothetical protein ABI655_13720 [Phenylobacterium sp.]